MAKQRPVVPQFGNWDNEDNVPYTVYFEKARKGKNGGKMINPNDPRENPGIFPPSAQPTPSKARINAPDEPIGRKAVRPTPVDNQSSRGNGDLNKFNEGPLRTDDNVIRQNIAGSTHQNRGGSGSGSGRPGRQNVGSDHSFDRSPLHPQYQAKPIGKNSGPAWESKHSNDSNQAAPGRSRMKPISTGDEYPDKGPKGAAVPRFGDWELADNFTEKFNNLREEKNSSSPMASKMSTEQTYAYRRKQVNHNKYKPRSSWFPCFRM